MVGWYHQLNGQESEQILRDSEPTREREPWKTCVRSTGESMLILGWVSHRERTQKSRQKSSKIGLPQLSGKESACKGRRHRFYV